MFGARDGLGVVGVLVVNHLQVTNSSSCSNNSNNDNDSRFLTLSASARWHVLPCTSISML
jgi:hypothetical protein